MSHQCLADAFEPAVVRYAAEVRKETWGHLAPKKNHIYRGHVIFAVGCFGSDELNPTTLDYDLKTRSGEDLQSSPWFYGYLVEFLSELDREAGGVYRWEGTFRNYEFVGTVRRLRLL